MKTKPLLLAALGLACLALAYYLLSQEHSMKALDEPLVPHTSAPHRFTEKTLLRVRKNMATQIADGITKEILKEGSGPTPQAGQTITVHCTGILPNGKKFWSTKDPGQTPFTFKVGLGQVIAGWDVGCLTMRLGEHSRLVARGDKAYGASGFPAWGIGPNATLTFDIEILKIA